MATEPVAVFGGHLQCWNNFDFHEEGGVRWGVLKVWDDRLEMTGQGLLALVFQCRMIPRERVRAVRPVRLAHPLRQLFPGVETVDVVVRPPRPPAGGTGDIHYLMRVRGSTRDELLTTLQRAGYPVSWDVLSITGFRIEAALRGASGVPGPGQQDPSLVQAPDEPPGASS